MHCRHIHFPMHLPLSVIKNSQHLWLSPLRVVYWEERKAVILSDLHFGKTGHFRKSGIAVPQQAYKEDLHRLLEVWHHFNPEEMIVVGDMFHSHDNKELDLFLKWRDNFPSLRIQLVKGNHDILHAAWYEKAAIRLYQGSLILAPFHFVHDPSQVEKNRKAAPPFYFSGHLHPGILVSGGGKQSLRFPCFHFTEHHCVLPAFGSFTGLAMVSPEPGDAVYAIVEQTLIQVA